MECSVHAASGLTDIPTAVENLTESETKPQHRSAFRTTESVIYCGDVVPHASAIRTQSKPLENASPIVADTHLAGWRGAGNHT